MKKSYLYVGICILCWSMVSALSKLMLGSLDNFQLLCGNALFAGIAMLIVCITNGKIKLLKTYSLKNIAVSTLLGLPGIFLYNAFYYAGTALMPASQAFIVNYLWPIMTVIAACVILKEKLTPRKAIALILSFIGVGIVAFKDILSLNFNIIMGSVFCILGAVSYGIFGALYRKYDYDQTLSMTLSYFATFAICGIVVLAKGDLFVPATLQIVGFAVNGVITMAVANTLWVAAMSSGNTAKLSNLTYITPFVSLVWTRLILKEPITTNAILGLLVIILGIFIQLKDGKKS